MEFEKNHFDYSLKLIAKSSVFVFLGLFFAKVFAYIYKIIIARYFGPEIYGLFSLALVILNWFVVFSALGLNQGILRYIPFYRGKNQLYKIKYIFKFAFFFTFLTSVLAGVFLFFFSETISTTFFHDEGLVIFLKIFSVVVPLSVLMQLFLFLILSFEKIKTYTFIHDILQDCVKVFSLVFLVFIGFKVSAVAFSYASGILISLLFAYFISKKIFVNLINKRLLREQEKIKISKEIFNYSWPLLFSGVIFALFYWADSFMIGLLMDTQSVGFYNAAVPIAMLLTITSEFFTKLFFPFITREYSKNKKNLELIKQLSKQIGKWIFAINFPLFILIIIFSEFFIKTFFGDQYLIAQNPLRILIFGAFFSSIFLISTQLLSMIGKTKIILMDTLFISIFNIFLNLILIKRYGISGAAISTTISLVSLNLLFLIQAKKYLSIVPLKRKIINIVAVSIIPTILIIFLKERFKPTSLLEVSLLISFFILCYLITILTTSCLDKNDLMILKSFKNKLSLLKN